jgi:hypothetical protein
MIFKYSLYLLARNPTDGGHVISLVGMFPIKHGVAKLLIIDLDNKRSARLKNQGRKFVVNLIENRIESVFRYYIAEKLKEDRTSSCKD